MRKIVEEELPEIEEISGEANAVLKRALSKEPTERFSSAVEFLKELEEVLKMETDINQSYSRNLSRTSKRYEYRPIPTYFGSISERVEELYLKISEMKRRFESSYRRVREELRDALKDVYLL